MLGRNLFHIFIQVDFMIIINIVAWCRFQTGITARDVARLARRRDVLEHLNRVTRYLHTHQAQSWTDRVLTWIFSKGTESKDANWFENVAKKKKKKKKKYSVNISLCVADDCSINIYTRVLFSFFLFSFFFEFELLEA